MMKKLSVGLLFCFLAFISASAQNTAENFTGKWKMIKMEGVSKTSTVTSIVLNVTQTSSKLNIERVTDGNYQNKSYSNTQIHKYDLNGTSTIGLISGEFGGVVESHLDFLGSDNLRLTNNFRRDTDKLNAINSGSIEWWKLSSNGNILTVKVKSGSNFSKIIFSKQ